MKYIYKTDFSRNFRIEKLEVVKETKGTITVIEKSPFGNDFDKKYVREGARKFYETWAEAKQGLIDEAQWKVQFARRQLDLAQSVLGNIKGMKEPE